MQDRFKFRVWQIVRTKGKDILAFMEFSECSAINLNNYIHRSDCIIEQCTGLKDKNGKLIYEGDIVTGFFNNNKVIWDKGSFCVDDGSGVFDELTRSSEESTIIGNIHENPELLEESND